MDRFLLLPLILLVAVAIFDVNSGESTDGACKESPWLCSQLEQMRALMEEQRQVLEKQRQVLEEQNIAIGQLQAKVVVQEDVIYQLQNNVSKQEAKLSHQDTMLMNLRKTLTELAAQPTNTSLETQNSAVYNFDLHRPSWNNTARSYSKSRDVMTRSDDKVYLNVLADQITMKAQLTQVMVDIQALKNTDQTLLNASQRQDHNIQDARTSTFVHWGSSQCANDSQLVYSGVVGGSSYDQSGGGSNYLCLTMSPIFGTHSIPSQYAYLHGSEYQTINDAHNDFDAVCAVCRSSHSTTIMIPGTNNCTQGWTKQYSGYLMAERDNHKSSEFVCVDEAMEGRLESQADKSGRLLYFTLTQCGSLPCGPYQNDKLVTCVVCSQ